MQSRLQMRIASYKHECFTVLKCGNTVFSGCIQGGLFTNSAVDDSWQANMEYFKYIKSLESNRLKSC